MKSICSRIYIVRNVLNVASTHRNKKCIEVATKEFLKGRLVLLLEIERPLSISHVFSKQSVFYFIKLSALFFSPLMLYFIFNPSLPFLPVSAGEISLYHVFLFWLFFGCCMVSSVAPSTLFIFRCFNPFSAAIFLEQETPSSKDCVRFVLRGNEERMYSHLLSGKSMWRSTPSELRVLRGTLHLEIEEDWVYFVLRGNGERMY